MVYLEKKGQNTLKVCFREESLRQHEKSQKLLKKFKSGTLQVNTFWVSKAKIR